MLSGIESEIFRGMFRKGVFRGIERGAPIKGKGIGIERGINRSTDDMEGEEEKGDKEGCTSLVSEEGCTPASGVVVLVGDGWMMLEVSELEITDNDNADKIVKGPVFDPGAST